ncbi:MAG: hypothetical protein DHS80DRAFT_30991 [Piptocephalis tieghemiana]|nr:MAG: hypothetical protein DHS80DRAFT_30991 [Piptocephalis tieghemiana]
MVYIHSLALTILALAGHSLAMSDHSPLCKADEAAMANGMEGSNSDLGFSITASSNAYSSNSPITITVASSAGKDISGLLLYVANADDTSRLGSFTIESGTSFQGNADNCGDYQMPGGDTAVVSHSSPDSKGSSVSFQWTPSSCEPATVHAIIVSGSKTSWQIPPELALTCSDSTDQADSSAIPSSVSSNYAVATSPAVYGDTAPEEQSSTDSGYTVDEDNGYPVAPEESEPAVSGGEEGASDSTYATGNTYSETPEASETASGEEGASDSSTPYASDSVYPEPSDSTYPEPSDSAYPGTSEPTVSGGEEGASDSAYPEASDSTYPEPSDSTYPEPSDSAYPEASDSVYPEPSDSAYPEPSDSAYPEPSDSAYPEASDSVYPEPSDSAYPGTSEPTVSGGEEGASDSAYPDASPSDYPTNDYVGRECYGGECGCSSGHCGGTQPPPPRCRRHPGGNRPTPVQVTYTTTTLPVEQPESDSESEELGYGAPPAGEDAGSESLGYGAAPLSDPTTGSYPSGEADGAEATSDSQYPEDGTDPTDVASVDPTSTEDEQTTASDMGYDANY